MRRINENDMSRIIKKVLSESPSQTDSFGDCFNKAGIPTPKSCNTMMKDINIIYHNSYTLNSIKYKLNNLIGLYVNQR